MLVRRKKVFFWTKNEEILSGKFHHLVFYTPLSRSHTHKHQNLFRKKTRECPSHNVNDNRTVIFLWK